MTSGSKSTQGQAPLIVTGKTPLGRTLSRRALLRGTSGIALGLPFLDAMRPQKARAQESQIRRVVFEFKPNGDEVEKRFDALGEDFVLGEFLAPLEPYREDLLFAHRVNKNFHRLPAGEQGDRHQQGGASLAPWPSGEGDFPVGGEERRIGYVLGPSADHAIGDRVLLEHPELPYRHLVFRVGDRDNNIWNLSSHAGPAGFKNPVLPETSPIAAYARLFGFLSADAPTSQLLHNLEMRRSVLDLVRGQTEQLSQRLGADDRRRLELHAEAIRDLERTLAQGQTSPQCQRIDLGTELDPYSGAEHVAVAQAFFKVMALAFACDLSRVVNFNWSGNTDNRVYTNLGLAEGHHDISHKSDDASFASIRSIHKHLWTNTTPLYDLLRATPEGDGTLWDSTLVVHWNELGQGDAHSVQDTLVVLGTGVNGFFKKGVAIDVGSKVAFSDLLVKCFHFMGFEDVLEFGDPRLSNGGEFVEQLFT